MFMLSAFSRVGGFRLHGRKRAVSVPTVGWVKSIEKTAATPTGASGTASLTKGQVAANCFPLPVSLNGTNNRNGDNRCAKISYSGSTATISRIEATDANLYTTYTVEVHPLAARVQAVPFTLAVGTTSGTFNIPAAVDLSKTFAVITFSNTYTGAIPDRTHARVKLVGTGAGGVSVSRQTGTGSALDGIVYLVECLTDAFTVQQVDIDTAENATANGTIAAVDTAKTFVISSFEHRGTGVTPDLTHAYSVLTDGTTITAGKNTASATDQVIATAFAISLKSDGGSVQRGTITRSSGLSGTATINSVDTSRSVAYSSGAYGAGSTASTTATDSVGLTSTIELTNATTVTDTASSNPGTNPSRTYRFAVIEFALAA